LPHIFSHEEKTDDKYYGFIAPHLSYITPLAWSKLCGRARGFGQERVT
jgi:hypothetical protein